MGIFDFLGDLSSKRSKELGLGGLQSLLGTRGAAQAGAIGDEMIGITNKDSLPGYFNEQTREYVPWYVDLFDGGGLNAAGGQTQEEAAKSGAAGATPGGAPIQSPGLLANNQLSDMERIQRSNPLSPFGGAGPAIQDTPDTSYYTPPSSMQMPVQGMPAPAQQGVLPQMQDNMPMFSPQTNSLQNNAEYQEFVKFLSDDGGFTRELENPEWMQKAFNRYMRSRAN